VDPDLAPYQRITEVKIMRIQEDPQDENNADPKGKINADLGGFQR